MEEVLRFQRLVPANVQVELNSPEACGSAPGLDGIPAAGVLRAANDVASTQAIRKALLRMMLCI